MSTKTTVLSDRTKLTLRFTGPDGKVLWAARHNHPTGPHWFLAVARSSAYSFRDVSWARRYMGIVKRFKQAIQEEGYSCEVVEVHVKKIRTRTTKVLYPQHPLVVLAELAPAGS